MELREASVIPENHRKPVSCFKQEQRYKARVKMLREMYVVEVKAYELV